MTGRIPKRFLYKMTIALTVVICAFNYSLCHSQSDISAWDLISLVNGMRNANGLASLNVDSYVMACAQGTAETMASSGMTWHIGNAAGRISSYGYNNGNACFATENFMMGGPGTTISSIQAAWSDESHMIPMTNPAYCAIGAGVATNADGFTYYVVQAAYPAGSKGCAYNNSSAGNSASVSSGSPAATADISQIIKNVTIAEPDEDGSIWHTVQDGQSLWMIATAYDTTVEVLQAWNNLGTGTALSLGQKLLIPNKDQAAGTPTPDIMLTVLPTADANGKYHHTVVEGETLWSISELWHVPLQSIYTSNGLSEDSSIGLGWELLIPVTPTNTLPPTATPTAEPTETPSPVPTDPPQETETPTSTVVLSPHLLPQGNTSILIIVLAGLAVVAVGFLLFDAVIKNPRKK